MDRSMLKDKSSRWLTLIALLSVWILVCIGWELGAKKAFVFLGIVLSGVLLRLAIHRWFFARRNPEARRLNRIRLLCALTVFGWTVLAKAVDLLRLDFLVLYITFASLLLIDLRRGRPKILAYLILPWVVLSMRYLVVDLASRHEKHPLVDPTRFAEIRHKSHYPELSIGVALSGGGYRAALYHAGVLEGLEELNLAPSHLTTVSGGSIIGSFYALGGAPRQFEQIMIAHEFNLAREVLLLQNLLRLPFPGKVPGSSLKLLPFYEFNRTDLQAGQLDRILLRGAKVRDLDFPSSPRLMICATDLRSGRQVAIGNDLLLSYRGLEHYHSADMFEGLPIAAGSSLMKNDFPRNESLARIVAASGGFPLAFPSTKIVAHSKEPGDDPAALNMLLADGGVIDNSGLTAMRVLEAESRDPQSDNQVTGWEIDLMLASDVAPVLSNEDETKASFDGGRAIDLIYSRVDPYPEDKISEAFIGDKRSTPVPKTISLAAQDLLYNDVGFFTAFSNSPRYGVTGSTIKLAISAHDVQVKVEALTDQEYALLFADCDDACRRGKIADRHTQRDANAHASEILASKLAADMTTFIHADTLRENYTAAEVTDLFELGRLRAILDAAAMRTTLEEARRQRQKLVAR
jgi:predicted acylesterase/phospholipase RssA